MLIKIAIIKKLPSGKYRLYSRKKDKSGKRRNLGTFNSLSAVKKHEKAVQYFKHHSDDGMADDHGTKSLKQLSNIAIYLDEGGFIDAADKIYMAMDAIDGSLDNSDDGDNAVDMFINTDNQMNVGGPRGEPGPYSGGAGDAPSLLSMDAPTLVVAKTAQDAPQQGTSDELFDKYFGKTQQATSGVMSPTAQKIKQSVQRLMLQSFQINQLLAAGVQQKGIKIYPVLQTNIDAFAEVFGQTMQDRITAAFEQNLPEQKVLEYLTALEASFQKSMNGTVGKIVQIDAMLKNWTGSDKIIAQYVTKTYHIEVTPQIMTRIRELINPYFQEMKPQVNRMMANPMDSIKLLQWGQEMWKKCFDNVVTMIVTEYGEYKADDVIAKALMHMVKAANILDQKGLYAEADLLDENLGKIIEELEDLRDKKKKDKTETDEDEEDEDEKEDVDVVVNSNGIDGTSVTDNQSAGMFQGLSDAYMYRGYGNLEGEYGPA